MLRNEKIFVAGHNGMVGRALCRALAAQQCDVLTVPRHRLDLTRQADTEDWMMAHKPAFVFVAAAHVGGIAANRDTPADFIYNNLAIQANIIHGAYKAGVRKLLFLGSSCIYPRGAPQPVGEDALLCGAPEPTNESYAVAKIAGIKMCQAYRRQYGCDFISAMPCNLYGPYDRFDAHRSHVIPALMMKFHAAQKQSLPSVSLWGTGRPLREFLHVDDLAAALLFLMERYSDESHINVGSGHDMSIAALAQKIAAITGYGGDILFDRFMPDGIPRKLMDSRKINAMGWRPHIDLDEGLRQTYQWFLEQYDTQKRRAS